MPTAYLNPLDLTRTTDDPDVLLDIAKNCETPDAVRGATERLKKQFPAHYSKLIHCKEIDSKKI